jgi:ADP-ribose pyrophosphatase YjhB (NUDIX family)
MNRISQEEEEFLKQYDLTKYDRPSVAADMAVFSVMGEQGEKQARDKENYRKLPKRKLKILLIRRGDHPYRGDWALPGGFGRRSEEIYETAKRELFEETQISEAYLKLIGVFGREGRDPRGWIISHTFLALIDGEKYQVRGGSDARDAAWFEVEFTQEKVSEKREKDHPGRSTLYRLRLVCEEKEEPVVLQALIRKEDVIRHFHTETEYFVEEEEGLAFDHAKLICYALLSLRQEVESDGRIVFDLMPEYFTLTELQKVVEIILDKALLTANFRRKMAVYVEETDRMITGAGHRPAKLFQRKDPFDS